MGESVENLDLQMGGREGTRQDGSVVDKWPQNWVSRRDLGFGPNVNGLDES